MLTRSSTPAVLRRAALVPLVGALGAAALACGGGAPADDGPCTTAATTSDASARPISLAQPRVDLLTSGTAPLRPLRATPDRTDAQPVRLTSTTTVLTRMADGGAPSREDQTVTVGATVRRHCTDDRDAALRFDSLSAADPAVSADLAKDAGSRGGITLGDEQVPISLRLWPTNQAPDTARAVLENTLATALQTLVALPAEPVGVGARWRVSRTLPGAATLHHTITATVRGRDGDIVDLDLTVEEAPAGSEYTVPGTGKALRIARYASLGRGTVRIDLRRVLPLGGSLDVRGARELVGADAANPLVQQTRYQLVWSR